MDTPKSKLTFNNLATSLADNSLGFISMESNNVTTLALPDLWEEIQETRILFTGPKSTGTSLLAPNTMSSWSIWKASGLDFRAGQKRMLQGKRRVPQC
jgi:hypothetical protein